MMKDATRGMMSRHGSSQGKRMVVVLWSLIFLLMGSVVHAEPVSSKDPLIEHLEFLGYECDLVEAGIRAKHPSKIHLYITYSFGGIRLQTGFPGKSPHSDVGSRYLVTNALMKQFSVIQLFWSEEGSLFAMGWMPGLYEKARFALFMEAWDHDTALLRQTYDQLKPFLIEQSKDPGNGS
jgi:hypothetical protein